MKKSLVLFLAVLIFPRSTYAQEPFYSNTHMGEHYKIFLTEKLLLEYRVYKFKTRVEFEKMDDSKKKYIKTSGWRLANCSKSTIDGKLIPAIPRYGSERGLPNLIREICGDGF